MVREMIAARVLPNERRPGYKRLHQIVCSTPLEALNPNATKMHAVVRATLPRARAPWSRSCAHTDSTDQAPAATRRPRHPRPCAHRARVALARRR